MSDADMYSSVCVVYIYIIYSSINTRSSPPWVSTFLRCPLPIHQLVYTQTHTHTNTHSLVSFWEDCPPAAHVVNTLYIFSDFLWQNCVVVLVILSKLTVDFSDKWLKLVCIWKRQMQDHLLPFLPKGVDYKNSCFLPPLCVPLCLCFLISVVKTWGKVEMYPGPSVFIYKKKTFFFLLNVTFGWLEE